MLSQLAKRIERVFDTRDGIGAAALCAAHYREHGLLPAAVTGARPGLADLLAGLPPDFRYSLDLAVVEGSLLAMIGTCEGLADGPLASVDLFRTHQGLLVEHWDALGPLQDPPHGLPSLRPYGPTSGASPVNIERAVQLMRQDPLEHVVFADRLCERFGAHAESRRAVNGARRRLERTVAEGDYVLLQSTLTADASDNLAYDLFEFGHDNAVRRWSLTDTRTTPEPSVPARRSGPLNRLGVSGVQT
ncbi:hypothetical protein OG401_40765 [Kitasatospora purpeofusca]|uniref:hypothetical protein n=1 Tax=Kitasatospora purpeofusca TaxID=67352 RepID=UPI00224CB606|nr:hypothetical protein [Kitasatospora purpeofusca]MCX4690557.1 hypothetical protein [Kitasatospora purpeofusca]